METDFLVHLNGGNIESSVSAASLEKFAASTKYIDDLFELAPHGLDLRDVSFPAPATLVKATTTELAAERPFPWEVEKPRPQPLAKAAVSPARREMLVRDLRQLKESGGDLAGFIAEQQKSQPVYAAELLGIATTEGLL
jgi:hypothetical protein